MKVTSRWQLQLLVTTVLAVVIGFAIPVQVDRQSYASAVAHYSREPTKENEAVLTVERAANQREIRTAHAEAAIALFVVMNGIWFLARRCSRRRSQQ